MVNLEIHEPSIIKHWPWDARIFKAGTLYNITLTLCCTILSCTCFFFPQKTCFSRPYCKFQLVSASPNWYSNVGHTNRLDYQDSPIQWHPNPMYSGVMEDMDPRSMDYGLTELPSAQPTMIINTAASVQQRSISRFGQHHFWKYGLLSFKLKDKIIRYIFG